MSKRMQDIFDRFMHFDKTHAAEGRYFLMSHAILSNAQNAVECGLKSNEKPEVKQLFKTNFVVNLSTALEVMVKTLIINSDWEEFGYELLLKESDHKITLNQAFVTFGPGKITRQYIISQYYSFQNFDKINEVLSALIRPNLSAKTNFMTEIGKAKFLPEPADASLNLTVPKWQDNLKRIFVLRNRFIHGGEQEGITDKEQFGLYTTVVFFMFALIFYLGYRSGWNETSRNK